LFKLFKIHNIINLLYFALIFLIIALGLYIRFDFYLQADPLWPDEMSLYLNILRRSFTELFQILDDNQTAPPLFCVISKIITELFGYKNVLYIRLPSIAAGCGAVCLFFLLLKKCFQNKIAIAAALFLLSVNISLIYYSKEFKTYSLDTFITIFLLFMYDKINIEKSRNFIFWAACFFILPFFSYTSLIIIFSVITLKFLDLVKNAETKKSSYIKLFLYYIIMFSAALILFCIKYKQYDFQAVYWTSYGGFLNFSYSSFIDLNVHFFQYMHVYSKFACILLCAGCLYAFFSGNSIMRLSLVCLAACYTASFFKIYPFRERLSMFLIPVFIMLIFAAFNIKESAFAGIWSRKGIKALKYACCIAAAYYFFISINISEDLAAVLGKNYEKMSIMQAPEDRILSLQDARKILNEYKSGEQILVNCSFFDIYLDYADIIDNYHKNIAKINLIFYWNDIYTLDADIFEKILSELNIKGNFWIIIDAYDKTGEYTDKFNGIIKEAIERLGLKYRIYVLANRPYAYYILQDNTAEN